MLNKFLIGRMNFNFSSYQIVEGLKKYVVYNIECNYKNLTWIVQKRYKELYNFYLMVKNC